MATQEAVQELARRMQHDQASAWLMPIIVLGGAVASIFWADTTEVFAGAVLAAVVLLPLWWKAFDLGAIAGKKNRAKHRRDWCGTLVSNAFSVACVVLGATVAPASLMVLVFLMALSVPGGGKKPYSAGVRRNQLVYAQTLPTVVAGLALMQLSGAHVLGVAVEIDSLPALLFLGFGALLLSMSAGFGWLANTAVPRGGDHDELNTDRCMLQKRSTIWVVGASFFFSLSLFLTAALAETGAVSEEVSMIMLLASGLAVALALVLSNGYGNYDLAVRGTNRLGEFQMCCNEGHTTRQLVRCGSTREHGVELGRYLLGVPSPPEDYGDSVHWRWGDETWPDFSATASANLNVSALLAPAVTEPDVQWAEKYGAKGSAEWWAARDRAAGQGWHNWVVEQQMPVNQTAMDKALAYLDLKENLDSGQIEEMETQQVRPSGGGEVAKASL